MSKALTLSGLMALLLPKERLFVIHHLGADISEAVARRHGRGARKNAVCRGVRK